jgi:hypothetical protein
MPIPRLAIAVLLVATARAAAAIEGDIGAHDPSRIIRCKDRYWIFHTGRGCRSKWSSDLFTWNDGPRVFDPLPGWIPEAAPDNNGDVWAPDIVYLNGLYHLYYSVSSWGSQESAIGLTTNPTLDPADPAFLWTDRGIVVQTKAGDDFNAIDPSVLHDTNGTLWLSVGSYWTGIKLVELSPATGKRISPASPVHSLAWHTSIEASYLHRRGSWYYLFVNRGSCCEGVTSTYRIRVGRSARVTGPYLDRDGVDLLDDGGTVFLDSTGRFVGPGHMGIFSEGGDDIFSYHYYDGARDGAATLGIGRLSWDAGGWPEFTNPWMSFHTFESDARDQVGLLDGALVDGAAIIADPQRGRVLDLAGDGGYASLHQGTARARTFSAWVKWAGGGAWQRIFDFGVDTSHYLMLTPRSSEGKLRFAIRDGEGEQSVDGPGPLPTGAWTHVAVTLDGSRGVLYLNGRAAATEDGIDIPPWRLQATNVWIGKSQFAADPPFQGRIDSVRIFGRALEASEVAALAADAEPDLLARYRFEETEGPIALDSSVNGNGAAIHGSPVREDGALRLDGAADFLMTPVGNGPERTLVAWIAPASSGDVTHIEGVIDSDLAGQYGSGWGLDGGRLKVVLDDRFWSPSVPVALDRWIHVALAFDRASARLFVDGILGSSITYAQGDVSRSSYKIGKGAPNPLYYHGSIRDVRIYGRALPAADIEAIYDGGGPGRLVRADGNADGTIDISDGIAVLSVLFLGQGDLPCRSAADANDDDEIDISDAVSVLAFLFSGGAAPSEPYPGCGRDPVAGGLACDSFPPCP